MAAHTGAWRHAWRTAGTNVRREVYDRIGALAAAKRQSRGQWVREALEEKLRREDVAAPSLAPAQEAGDCQQVRRHTDLCR